VTANKSQDEMEAPAKVYQVDAIATQLTDIKSLILANNVTYVTKDELKLELLERDGKISTLRGTLKTYSKVIWIVGSAILYLLATNAWQLLTNTNRVG